MICHYYRRSHESLTPHIISHANQKGTFHTALVRGHQFDHKVSRARQTLFGFRSGDFTGFLSKKAKGQYLKESRRKATAKPKDSTQRKTHKGELHFRNARKATAGLHRPNTVLDPPGNCPSKHQGWVGASGNKWELLG